MKIFFLKTIFTLSLIVLLTSCESQYSREVKRELKTGVVHEDLIFGLKLGQTRKQFYDRCWNLNKQKLVSQGPGNQYAKHVMVIDSTVEDSPKVEMLFYGIFDESKVMHGMDMKMSFLGWSPWNKDYHSDKLMEQLKEKYLREFPGNRFVEIDIDDNIKALAKIDGNRQILMYPLTNKNVSVKIQDLRHLKIGTQ